MAHPEKGPSLARVRAWLLQQLKDMQGAAAAAAAPEPERARRSRPAPKSTWQAGCPEIYTLLRVRVVPPRPDPASPTPAAPP